MCYYCRCLAHERSQTPDDVGQYFQQDLVYRSKRSCHLPMLFRLVGITSFFLLLNITIVLSQSSQVQQQRDQSASKIPDANSQGNRRSSSLLTSEKIASADRQSLSSITKPRAGLHVQRSLDENGSHQRARSFACRISETLNRLEFIFQFLFLPDG